MLRLGARADSLRKTADAVLGQTVYDPAVGRRLSRPLYWTLAPIVWKRWYPTDFVDSTAAPDPFKIERVDPRRIRRFTPRVYPAWHRRASSFGTVAGGDWDRRSFDEVPTHGGPPMDLFYADRIEGGLLYRAIASHFRDGVAWGETAFVRRVLEYLDEGRRFVWHDCSSREDVFDRCRELSSIYRDIARRGCLTYRERTPPSSRDIGFLQAMQQEIVVDVGRDGELLLVSGKHRYCLARVLGLEEIPVTFLVRHGRWMETRRAVARGDDPRSVDVDSDHPDLRDLT